jgi:hypothetical protein
MQILVPLTVFLVIAFLFAALAAKPKKEGNRVLFGMAGIIAISVIIGSITYPFGGYYLRTLSYHGTERMKEFIEDIHADLEAGEQATAKKKIEFILAEWDDIEFLEKENDWGTYIGELVDQAKQIENETEPAGTGQPM